MEVVCAVARCLGKDLAVQHRRIRQVAAVLAAHGAKGKLRLVDWQSPRASAEGVAPMAEPQRRSPRRLV